MMKKYVIGLITVVAILVITFGGYYIYSSNRSQNSIDSLKSKANSEIDFLGTTIISMMNSLNNISYENYKIVENTPSSDDKKAQGNTTEGRKNWNWYAKSNRRRK